MIYGMASIRNFTKHCIDRYGQQRINLSSEDFKLFKLVIRVQSMIAFAYEKISVKKVFLR
jgi:hypothetical protein